MKTNIDFIPTEKVIDSNYIS